MTSGAATRRRRSRQKIVTAAGDVFLETGFLGASMDTIADRAGVSKQTVYAHFASKEALFIHVVEAMTGGAARDLREDVEEALDDRPVEDYLNRTAIDQLTIVMTPALMRLRRMVIGEVDRFPALGRSLFENGPRKSIDKLARAFAHYTARGQLDVSDPADAATLFNWMLMGAPTNSAMLLGDAGLPTPAQIEAHAAETVRIFLAAYGTSRHD
ncbi:MAG: TetR/AcrR family transcriptional regulator [Roseitalea sp.]|jgi:AcrR family transcriptional regulator|nr:TetR/AcrR family transcriptional regulator [Roseitalea sp.]MBO6721332.1 TetR/AcrR family transcriptional regulator [Roseitalea sp.]MBO6742183.1 TetR/AcrR family transcriptional regulator [Roseitalea sp.]